MHFFVSKVELLHAFFCVRLLHAVAFKPTNVITLKIQLHAVTAHLKRVSQRSFSLTSYGKSINFFSLAGRYKYLAIFF